MEIMAEIQVGLADEADFVVEERFTATHIGSGSIFVLATPSMIGFMERLARDLLAQHLPEGYSSVGAWVDVHHLAPTPLGASVRVRCEVVEVNGRRVLFDVQAWDAYEKVGEGRHQRVVIDVARFLQRLQSKSAS